MLKIVFYHGNIVLTKTHSTNTRWMPVMCSFFHCLSVSSTVSPLSSLSYLSLHGPHTFSNYIPAIILGWHFCTVNHAHFVITHRSKCVWMRRGYEREREREPKRIKLHVNHSCLPGRLLWAPSWLYVCVCVLALAVHICTYYHLYPSWKCVIHLSVHVTCTCVCLSFPHIAIAQYMTRVMMCKVMMCNHPSLPGRSQPLASDAPLHTLVFVRVSVFQANLAGVCSPFYSLQAVCCLLFLL